MLDHPAIAAAAQQRLVAIIRTSTAADAVAAGSALFDAGLRVIEVSLLTARALDAIAELAAKRPADGFVGAGTVLSIEDVRSSEAAGATFMVSPNTDVDVVRESARRSLGAIPAAATPNELLAAHRAGAGLLKLFPASQWSPKALRDMLTALPMLRTVPTGGIALADASQWISAGATAVGMGGALANGPANEVRGRGAKLLAALATAAR